MVKLDRYRSIHDSFYGIKSLVVQLDDIVNRYRRATDDVSYSFDCNDSIINQPIWKSRPECFSQLSNLPPIKKEVHENLKCSDVDKSTTLSKKDECPYALPPPCSLPSCPFRSQEIRCTKRESFDKVRQTDKNLRVCSNTDCPYKRNDQMKAQNLSQRGCRSNVNSTEFSGDGDGTLVRKPYRSCIKLDEEPENETQYTCDDRTDIDTRPCRPDTCFKQKGTLECIECLELPKKNFRVCTNVNCPYHKNDHVKTKDVSPRSCRFNVKSREDSDRALVKKPYRSTIKLDEEPETETQYTCDDRTDIDTRPCRVGTCFKQKGTLECIECVEQPIPKDKKSDEEPGDAIQYTVEDRTDIDTRPCRPDNCFKHKGTLECVECLEPTQEPDIETQYTVETRIDIDTRPCRPGLCSKYKGILECIECSESSQKSKKTKKQQQQMQFNKEPYKWSSKDRYPGFHIGHRECCTPAFPVPPKQGWLWNIPLPALDFRLRRGWRPGAVRRKIAARIRKHNKMHEMMLNAQQDQAAAQIIPKKPNLLVEKKDGAYLVTMNCAKDPNCKPLQFKIDKNKEQTCNCDDDDNEDDDDDDDESSGRYEFELTSPTAMKQRKSAKRPRKTTAHETQYNVADFQKATKKGKKGDKKKKKKKDKKKKKNKKKKK